MSRNYERFSSLHPADAISVKELCTLVTLQGEVFAVFPSEDDACDCEVFFPSHKGFVCFNSPVLNAIKIV